MPDSEMFEVDGVIFEIRWRRSDDGQNVEVQAFKKDQPVDGVSSVPVETVGDMEKENGDSAVQVAVQGLKLQLDREYGQYEVVKANNDSTSSVVDTIQGQAKADRRAEALNNERLSVHFYARRRSRPHAG
jgi:hypothetical protein